MRHVDHLRAVDMPSPAATRPLGLSAYPQVRFTEPIPWHDDIRNLQAAIDENPVGVCMLLNDLAM